jgi:predicted DsbA family dithiol-disulfide isomerase
VHFPLHPDTPPEGRSLADLFRGRNVDRGAMHAQMKARMTAEGLPYGDRTMTYNSRLAQELGKWADTVPGRKAIHDALFRAYFVEARDISRPAVLLEVAEQAGLSVADAREVLEQRAHVQGRRRPGLAALA